MKCNLYAAAVIALSASIFLPATAMAQVEFSVVIGNPPPPPRFERAPAPRRGYVWAPGFWNWDGQAHSWTSGRWEPERNGYQFQRAEWLHDNGAWRLNRGGWIAVQSGDQYVRVAPPPPRQEWTPRPRPGLLWSPGHWEWRGQRYQWVPGIWLAERPGYDYSGAVWVERDGRWYHEPGRWTPRGGPRRDHDWHGNPREHERGFERDHERGFERGNERGYERGPGHDRDRDHDGVPNRLDRDRDGDGVPNRFDSRPDNPRRN